MEELIEHSALLVTTSGLATRSEMARELAQWALPGDRFDKASGRFAVSGLSLAPFEELVGFVRDSVGTGADLDLADIRTAM